MRFRVLAVVALALMLGPQYTFAESHPQDETNCVDCHRDQGQDQHFQAADCLWCHEFENSGETHLARTNTDPETCRICHFDIETTLAIGRGHAELLCVDCHDSHGGELEYRLKTDIMSLCAETCHGDGQLGISHPVGLGVRDKNIGSDMTCTSTCHSMHNPREEPLLQLASMDLCNSCHAEKF